VVTDRVDQNKDELLEPRGLFLVHLPFELIDQFFCGCPQRTDIMLREAFEDTSNGVALSPMRTLNRG
jgi:hypothetical protein